MSIESNWDLFHNARWNLFLKSLKDIEISPAVKAIFEGAMFIGVDYKKYKVVIDGALVTNKYFQNALESEKSLWINSLIKCFPECNDLFIGHPIIKKMKDDEYV